MAPDDAQPAEARGTVLLSCREAQDSRTVPAVFLDENGRMEAWGNDLVIRYLDRMVVRDDGYEVAFKAGVTVEVEV